MLCLSELEQRYVLQLSDALPPPLQVRAELLSKTREIPPDMVEVRINIEFASNECRVRC